MLKHSVELQSPKGAASVVFLYTGWFYQLRQYVCCATIEGQLYPFHGESAQAAVDGAVKFIEATRYRILRAPTLMAASRVRCYRWEGSCFLAHFLLSVPLTLEQVKLLAGTSSEQASALLSTWPGSPLYQSWPADSTIRWRGMRDDAERIFNAAQDDDLSPPNEDFWTQA